MERSTGRDMLWSPTIRAALLARTPWLDVFCPGCATSRAIDLRTIDRHPLASVGTLVLGLRCSSPLAFVPPSKRTRSASTGFKAASEAAALAKSSSCPIGPCTEQKSMTSGRPGSMWPVGGRRASPQYLHAKGIHASVNCLSPAARFRPRVRG
jgi:hypothetical protein